MNLPGGRGGTGIRPATEKPGNLTGTLLRIFGYLGENRAILLLVALAIVASSTSTMAGYYLLKPIINRYIVPGDLHGLARALGLLALVYLVGVSANYLQATTTVRLAQRTTNAIRRELFDRMQTLPLRYYDAHTHGELMSRYTNDIDNIGAMLEQSLSQLLSSIVLFVGTVGCMLLLSPLLFLGTASVLSVMFLTSRKIGRKSRGYFMEQQRLLGKLDGYIEENITGLREIKAFNHEKPSIDAFLALNENFRRTAARAGFLAVVIMPIMFNLNSISYACSAVFGGLLAIRGALDVGSLASYLLFSKQIGQPINQVTNQMNNIYAAVAGAERVFALMDELPEVDEGKTLLVENATGEGETRWAWRIAGSDTPLRGDVRFENVSFSYTPEKPVLKGVSLYAKPGQVIAFVGSTGAGKTTIVNLINRFYDVDEGQITYDGIDVRNIRKESLRRSLGMVLQDTHLFTGTVMENIRYGRLGASDQECVEAAKNTGAHSFIRRLAKGYESLLTDDGANLSQGERQLLAIARAYIADPPVMILDEATSSIDTRTELRIQRAMEELMKGRTVFVIAHRLSTVRHANAIIVLENGAIVERGDHDELLNHRGRYYQLYTGAAELA